MPQRDWRKAGSESRYLCTEAFGGSGGIAGTAQWVLGREDDKSGLLWLRYVLEAERHSRWIPRITLRYGDLLRHWRAESRRVAHALGIVWPKPFDEAVELPPYDSYVAACWLER